MTKSVFPAYAGMSPRKELPMNRVARFPRLRGDEPAFRAAVQLDMAFSPPTRG